MRKTDGVWVHRENWIHMETCQNFIYCRPVMRALLALPPSAPRYTSAELSGSPCTQAHPVAGGQIQPLCLCTCLWQVEILCVPVVMQQRSLPPTSRSYKLTQLLGEEKKKEKRRSGDVCLQYLSFSYARVDFCLDFHLALISSTPHPSGSCATFFCMLVSR